MTEYLGILKNLNLAHKAVIHSLRSSSYVDIACNSLEKVAYSLPESVTSIFGFVKKKKEELQSFVQSKTPESLVSIGSSLKGNLSGLLCNALSNYVSLSSKGYSYEVVLSMVAFNLINDATQAVVKKKRADFLSSDPDVLDEETTPPAHQLKASESQHYLSVGFDAANVLLKLTNFALNFESSELNPNKTANYIINAINIAAEINISRNQRRNISKKINLLLSSKKRRQEQSFTDKVRSSRTDPRGPSVGA